MNKEPIGLYVFRFVLGFGLFAFMGMLYWSSVLIEQNCKGIRSDISQLKNDLFALRSETERVRVDVLKLISTPVETRYQAIPKPSAHHEDSSNNLLQEDPFYATTLPKILGNNFVASGTRRTGSVGRPEHLHPFSNWIQVSNWIDLCTPSVSKLQFGKFETMAPDMAWKMEERINSQTGLPEFWIFLRDNVFWQPLKQEFFSKDVKLAPEFFRKNQVTAEDFKFYYDAIMNPYVEEAGAVALRTYYEDIKEIEVVDKLTFIVRWKSEEVFEDGQSRQKIKYVAKQLTGGLKPLASFVYKYFPNGKKIVENDSGPNTYRTNSVWAQNFSRHWAKHIIVSCGPWIFDGMTDRQIGFVRNSDFYFPLAALTERIEFDFKDTQEAIWQDFKSNRADTCALQPEQVLESKDFLQSAPYQEQVRKGLAIKQLDYVSRMYTYIGWNQAKPYFTSAKVRRALTMAIDRRRIIEQNLHGMGIEIHGTFYRFSPAYDTQIAPWPFDVDQARRLLEEEGWFDSDGDGYIDKIIDGEKIPFQFALTYFVKNPTVKAICEYVATALKDVGISCSLNGVDLADISAVFEDKSFDALCLGWALGTPPDDPKQLWFSAGAKEKGSSNAVGFSNPEADAIINRLQYEYNPEKRIQLYHRLDAILHEEQPYTFLFTPKTRFLYREYVHNVFLPIDRQDLIPGANVAEPDSNIFWITPHTSL